MNQKKLIETLKKYLESKKINYYTDSLNFKGIRKNVPQPDGSTRELFTVSFMSSVNNSEYDSDIIYYAYFDITSEKLLYIIGPQFYNIVG